MSLCTEAYCHPQCSKLLAIEENCKKMQMNVIVPETDFARVLILTNRMMTGYRILAKPS